MALPLSAGALQDTVRLVVLPETPATVGAAGATGAAVPAAVSVADTVAPTVQPRP